MPSTFASAIASRFPSSWRSSTRSNPRGSAANPTNGLGVATVLVVDDDANARLLVRTLLGYAGHDALEAAGGAEGLALAAAHRPDLVLLDLSMPTMSGAEFVRALRADAQTKDIAVALYTATSSSAAVRDFMEMYHIRHAIPKPSEPREFLEALKQALSPSHGSP
jgi:CheY-like chemotaxis protein